MDIVREAALQHLRWERSGKHGRTLNVADKESRISCQIARRFGEALEERYGIGISGEPAGGEPGSRFQNLIRDWLDEEIAQWGLQGTLSASCGQPIDRFYQYQHLADLRHLVQQDPSGELEIALGGDYVIKPDVVVQWENRPWSDLVSTESDLVSRESAHRFLHASISCKWTIRSDRVQNVRQEAANLVGRRRGQPPHFVCVTAEPLPTRLVAVAGGDGDLDCTYHLDLAILWSVLNELVGADERFRRQNRSLSMLVRGRKLRPLALLPQDILGVPGREAVSQDSQPRSATTRGSQPDFRE